MSQKKHLIYTLKHHTALFLVVAYSLFLIVSLINYWAVTLNDTQFLYASILPIQHLPNKTVIANFADQDNDGILNDLDNCPLQPNGPILGTCLFDPSFTLCIKNSDCHTNLCSLGQEDAYPCYNIGEDKIVCPGGNGIGDVCECEGDFDCDGDVDSLDLVKIQNDLGRNASTNPCARQNPCSGDFDCDGDVDNRDWLVFETNLNRTLFSENPCPVCKSDDYCNYPR